MTLLYRHAEFLAHDTGQHPENAQRLLAINSRLDASTQNKSLNRDYIPILKLHFL